MLVLLCWLVLSRKKLFSAEVLMLALFHFSFSLVLLDLPVSLFSLVQSSEK